MKTEEKYYRDGYNLIEFDSRKLNDVVARMSDVNNDTFMWQQKYPHSTDFRPSAVQYDSAFIDTLIENDVPGKLEEATLSSDLTLIHCQVRRASYYTPQYSYMPWHRDTYLDRDGKWVGPTPPGHKLIIYLDPHSRQEPRLTVIPGSHRRMFDQPDMDLQAYGRMKLTNLGVQVNASNKRALMFNVSLLHSVHPETHIEGSTRVIYSFMTQRQFDNSAHAKIDIHNEIRRAYENAKRVK